MARIYGSIINRMSEGKTVPEIKEGMNITMYLYSDRRCYYVTKVIDQKHILVKEYHVCADQESKDMSNNWKFFKTAKEKNEYLNKFRPDIERNNYEYPEEEWVYRYGKWNEKLNGKYSKLSPISFGVRSYYYDYSF